MGESNAKTGTYGVGDASYQAAGRQPGLERLVDAFYRIMDEDPAARRIRDMHPTDLEESRDKLTRFLCGWLNGPKLYREKFGPIRLPRAHAHLPITSEDAEAWLSCMERAIAEQDFADDFSAYLMRELRKPAERIVRVAQGGSPNPPSSD